MNQPLDLTAIKARAQAATDGPWRLEAHAGLGQHGVLGPANWSVGALEFGDGPDADADREFVINAPTDIAALIAKVEHLTAEVERLSATRAEVRSAIALDLMELHGDPATPERYRAGLRAAARRIPLAQDGGY